MPTSAAYVVPARRLLTAVHAADPDNPRRTMCGLDMAPEELWVPWPFEAGRDRLCCACAGEAPAFEEQTLM